MSPETRDRKFSTVRGTVWPKSPMTTLPAGFPSTETSKYTLSVIVSGSVVVSATEASTPPDVATTVMPARKAFFVHSATDPTVRILSDIGSLVDIERTFVPRIVRGSRRELAGSASKRTATSKYAMVERAIDILIAEGFRIRHSREPM